MKKHKLSKSDENTLVNICLFAADALDGFNGSVQAYVSKAEVIELMKSFSLSRSGLASLDDIEHPNGHCDNPEIQEVLDRGLA